MADSTTPDGIIWAEPDDFAKDASVESAISNHFKATAVSTQAAFTSRMAGVDSRFASTESKNVEQDDRLGQLEVIGGLEPGDVSDATMANIAANENSMFHEYLRYASDDASYGNTLREIDHYATATFAYGLDIQNFPGATSALVVHQYSSAGNGAVVLDNTGSAPMIRIKNTENTVLNPGSHGTGPFMRLGPWSGGRLDFRDDLKWENTTTHPFGVVNTGSTVAFSVEQQTSGLWGVSVTSPTSGAQVILTGSPTTSHQGVRVVVPAGQAQGVRIENSGTGWSLYIRDGSAGVSGITATGEFEKLTPGGGIVLKSTNGTRYRIGVNDSGQVVTAAA